MAYYPRKRARSIIARIRRWVDIGKPQLLGFAGYKVGTVHVVKLEDNPNSPLYGQEVVKVATVIEAPPLFVLALRAYERSAYGLRSLVEVWAKELPEDVSRVFTVPKESVYEDQMKNLEKLKDKISEIRVIVSMQPRKTGIGKKKPEIFEIKIGGKPQDALNYALKVLGKEVNITEVFQVGQFVDVVSITRGKGFSGVVKRFGVKIMPRWHKHRKGYRRIGAVGPQSPAIMFTTPFAGQLGFHQRTEYNKRILKIGDPQTEPINPPGGWTHYGLIRSTFLLVEGTIPGPAKRLVMLRFPVRPRKERREQPKVVYVSVGSREGESNG